MTEDNLTKRVALLQSLAKVAYPLEATSMRIPASLSRCSGRRTRLRRG